MKFNFKKIASVIASTVMLSSTVALAAAANYPAPFVSNGVADVAVVYGASAAQTDLLAATEITTNLNSNLVTAGAVTTVTGGDFLQIAKSTNKFNLGESFTSIYTNLDDDELSNILAEGVYEDDDGTEYDYDQTITLAGLTLTHFADDDVDADEVPVIGFEIASNTNVLNYSLEFIDYVDNSSALLETTDLTILGREYYISDWDSTNLKMTLLDTANTATVYENEPKSVVVGAKTYTVELISVDGTDDEAILSVDGVEYDAIGEGNSRKIAEDTYLSVLDLKEASRESDTHWVKFSIGTGQLILENGNNLEVNEDSIDEIAVSFTVISDEITQLDLIWTTDDDEFITSDMDMIMPGFEVIKLSMGSFIRSDLEEFTVKVNGDDYMEITSLDLKDGSVTLPLLYSNSSKTGFTGLGKDSTHILVTNRSGSPAIALDESVNTRFVASWENGDDWETYYFELTSINEKDSGIKNLTKIKNLANSDTIEFTDSGSGDDKSVGELTFTVSNTNGDAETALLVITADSGTAYADRVYTAEGLEIFLPVDSTTVGGQGTIVNITADEPTSWIMQFTEADEDDNVGTGQQFNATLGHTTNDGPEVDSVSATTLEVKSGSDDEEAYISGANGHATKLLFMTGGDNDELDVEYPGEESYAEVYISEMGATVTAEGAATALLITDAEAATTTANNVVVVGGSCINSVAADLLGGALCGADFEAATGVGAGSFLIETFSYGTDGVATLVAGYNAGDTTNAATYLRTQTVDSTAGMKYTGTSATSAQLVTTTA